MKTIYLDSTQIHDYTTVSAGLFVKQDIQGLEIPEVRLATYDKSGEHGAYISNQLYGGRLITLEGGIYSTTQSTFESLRRTIISATQVTKDSNGVPVAKTLKFTTLDDIALQCSVYMRKLTMKKQKYCYIDYQLELFAPNIALESQTLTTTGLSILASGGAVYPIIYPVTYGASTTGTISMTNNGTIDAWPTLTITGVLTNPVITNSTTGKYMALSITLGASDTLVVDMKNKTIVLNGSTNSLSVKDLASEWWTLQPGANTITLTTGSGGDNGAVSVAYRDSYLGV